MKKKTYTFSTYKNLYQNDFKYNELEKYFEIQRTEHEAAKSIQKIWRKTRVLLPWRKAVHINKVIIIIQKRFRGFLVRKWVAEWYYTRNNIVINWQAHVRRHLSNLHIRPKLYYDQLMAIKIQKVIRGKLARLYYIVLVRNQAALRIQIMWRGLIARLLTDKLWLQKVVIPIQNFYRKCIAQRKYKNIKILRNTAALIIQKQYRNFYAKQSLGKRLYDREISYRDLNIKVLSAEEELYQEHLSKNMERLMRNNLKQKATNSLKLLQDSEYEIYQLENTYIEFLRQSEIISSRAKEQGFDLELKNNIIDTRKKITTLKLTCIFELSPNVYANDERLEDQVREIETWAACRSKVSGTRTMEYEDKRHVTYKRELLRLRREKRMKIADERRKWQVLYYSKDGKPDKNRRPGRPWNPAILAGLEKTVYSAGHKVNLLAHLQKAHNSNIKDNNLITKEEEGSSTTMKSISNTLDQVALQTYFDEIKLYEQLLNPISEIMKNTMGITPMGTSNLQESGWGLEGAKIIPALQNIGMIPSGGRGLSNTTTPLSLSSSPQKYLQQEQFNNNIASTSISDDHHKKQLLLKSSSSTISSIGTAISKKSRRTLLRLGTALSFKNIANDTDSISFIDSDNHNYDNNISKPNQLSPVQSNISKQFQEIDHNNNNQPSLLNLPHEIFTNLRLKKQKVKRKFLPALDAFIFEHYPTNKNEEFMELSYSIANKYKILTKNQDTNDQLDDNKNHSIKDYHTTTNHKNNTKKNNNKTNTNNGTYIKDRKNELSPKFLTKQRSLKENLISEQHKEYNMKVNKNNNNHDSNMIIPVKSVENAALVSINDQSTDMITDTTYYFDNIHYETRKEDLKLRKIQVQHRRERKERNRRTGAINWELLDEVDGQKQRFENEKSYVEFNFKY